NQVVLVQAPVTQVTVVVSDRADHGSSETPPSAPVINSTADVPVDVVELESISDTVIATPQAIDLPRRYLIKDSHDTTTASTTSTTTTITPTSIIPPIPPASTSAPSTSNSPVQRRTTLRRGFILPLIAILSVTTPKRTSTAAKFSGGRRSTVSWDPTITAVDWTDEMLAISPVDHTGRPSYLL
ncbi:hypothetical protein BD560DRAFT_440663, partial [Blakeslea trispora]